MGNAPSAPQKKKSQKQKWEWEHRNGRMQVKPRAAKPKPKPRSIWLEPKANDYNLWIFNPNLSSKKRRSVNS